MQSELHCMHCGNRSCKSEPFLDISLSIDTSSPWTGSNHSGAKLLEMDLTTDGMNGSSSSSSSSSSSNGAADDAIHSGSRFPSASSSSATSSSSSSSSSDRTLSLAECLQHFTSLETLSEQIFCENCTTPRPAKKRLSLSSTPRVLVLHFKRFDSLRQLKICSKVTFPMKGLDLSPFVYQQSSSSSSSSSSSVPSQQQQKPIGNGQTNNPYLYDLQGLVNHKGSLSQGHYVAYVASLNGGSSLHSDSTVWLRYGISLQYPLFS